MTSRSLCGLIAITSISGGGTLLQCSISYSSLLAEHTEVRGRRLVADLSTTCSRSNGAAEIASKRQRRQAVKHRYEQVTLSSATRLEAPKSRTSAGGPEITSRRLSGPVLRMHR